MMDLLPRLLRAAGVHVADPSALEGLVVDRNTFLRPDAYLDAAHLLPELRRRFSTTHLTALQNDAPSTQRWPLLNLVRQVLRASGYEMVPIRVSDGYDPGRKKRYKRAFAIEKAPQTG